MLSPLLDLVGRPHAWRRSLGAVLLAIVVAPAIAEPTLSLEQAQGLAIAHTRQLAGLDAAVRASREMAVAAAQRPDPILKLGIDNLAVSGADRFSLSNEFMTMRRVGVMLELTRADKRRWRAESYGRAADKASAEKALAGAAIERDTAIAWLERYYAQENAALVGAQATQARQEIDAAAAAYRGGKGSQAEILAARGALGMIEDRASDAERRLRAATIMLARWIGDSASLALAGPPNINAIPLDLAQLENHVAHHPQIAVLARQEDIALAEVRLAEAGRRPDWSVELAFQQRGPAFSNMVSVGLSVPLQWDRKNRQDREVGARLALAEQASAEREEGLRAHLAETRVLVAEWASGRERIARYERDLLPLASERSAAVLAAYRGGKATLADVLAARRNETEVRQQALQLQMETARTWAQLSFMAPNQHHDNTNGKAQ